MWSDNYFYLSIYKDKNLSSAVATKSILEFLDALPDLKKTSDFRYGNTSIDVLTLFAKSADSWSDKDTNSELTNLVAIVCAKGEAADFETQKNLLIKIAAFLNWQLINEQTDDGIEDFVIWSPDTNSN